MDRSPYYPYPPRTGFNLVANAINPETAPAKLLSPEALQKVIDFEHQLYDTALDPVMFPSAEAYRLLKDAEGTPMLPIETVWEQRINSTELGINYFLTEAGRQSLLTAAHVGAPDSPAECAQVLCGIDISKIDSKVLKALEDSSIGYEEAELMRVFTENSFDGANVPAPSIVTIHKNPEILVEKARGFRQLKTYYSRAKTDLMAGDNTESREAKVLIVDLYKKRLNTLLAEVYIDAYKLLAQHQIGDIGLHTEAIEQLTDILPAFFNRGDDDANAKFMQRIDRFRYGVGKDDQGKFSWLSPQAQALSERQPKETATTDRGIYSDTDPATLENTVIDGTTFGSLIAHVLSEYGLLSTSTDWDSERTEPAPDGKWRAVVNGAFKSLAVNGKIRVVKVPTKDTSVASAVIGTNHEVVHVLQHENKRAIGKLAILERIGLDEAADQFEAGGIWQEEIASKMLTGQASQEVTGTSYLRATEVKARGGTFGKAVEAFYNELLIEEPQLTHNAAAARAVNRVRRVYRSGGLEFAQDNSYVTNTRSLSYLEQRLIYEGLGAEQRKMLFVGGMTVATMTLLSSHGLIDTDKIQIPDKMPVELLYTKVKELIA